ncbi:activating signal cointegrator 1 isoform X1 [Rhipicephalus sanguineus]|uniref:activating signal cointegrator 1 isoform X1 n=1 Tax=Rhipicephalus sanguineus TaxID=34632 RepID=UPI0018960094|nr:activating signal cointegrator 1 isoform X1 [Rhipicephalus sanguineus]
MSRASQDGDAPMKVYKKAELQDYVQPQKSKSSKKKGSSSKQEPAQETLERLESSMSSNQGPEQQGGPEEERSNIAMTQNATRRKQRFVNLYSQEGRARDVVLLPGRHPCECQAHRHALINNCLRCGRIVCRQEGSGPCFTCGNLVCTNEEKEILSHDSKKSHQLRNKLMNQTIDEGLAKAIEHKNRLLEYDRTSERRTRVIDDNADYYSSDNKWLTLEQREMIRKKEQELRAEQHASRRQQKVTLDFAGRQVVKEDPQHASIQSLLQSLVAPMAETNINDRVCREVESTHFMDPALDMPPPEYMPTGALRAPKRNRPMGDNSLVSTSSSGQVLSSRIQDRALMEMSDDGFALSVQQPFAGLLVSGIKKHEGRAWFTTYRGRLWIHAASRQPSQEDISEVVGIYRKIVNETEVVKFPDEYPTSCLLGCVNLVDCLPQDIYREQYPFGECFSPFVFICEEPQELKTKFPMKGQHKIFKMDSRLHHAAKKTLLCPQILAS